MGEALTNEESGALVFEVVLAWGREAATDRIVPPPLPMSMHDYSCLCAYLYTKGAAFAYMGPPARDMPTLCGVRLDVRDG